MKAAKNKKNLNETPYQPQKKALKKKRKQYYASKGKCPNFTIFLRMPKINNSNLSNEKQRTLKEAWTT